MSTANGKELDVGWTHKSAEEFRVTVAGGLLLGAYGARGSSIDRLGFLFIKSKVQKVSITNVEYTDLPKPGDTSNLEPVALLGTTVGNAKGDNNNVTVTGAVAQAVVSTTSYSQAASITYGTDVTVEISAAPLGVGGKVTTGFRLEGRRDDDARDRGYGQHDYHKHGFAGHWAGAGNALHTCECLVLSLLLFLFPVSLFSPDWS